MLKCFIDDSGSDQQEDGIFVLAGYIMQEPRWEVFTEDWNAVLKKQPSIAYCRMADVADGNGPFAHLRFDFRELKVKALSTVIKDAYPTALESRMIWSTYNAIMKGRVEKRLDNPYAILFFKIMAMVAEVQIQSNRVANFGFEPVDFIFDDQGDAGAQCLKWYYQLKERVAEPIVLSLPMSHNSWMIAT